MSKPELISNFKSRVFAKQQLNKNRILVNSFIRRNARSLPLTKTEYTMLTEMKNGATTIPYTTAINNRKLNRIAFYSGIRSVVKYNSESQNWDCVPIDVDFMISDSYSEYFTDNVLDVVKATSELEFVYKAKISKFCDDHLLKEYEAKHRIKDVKESHEVVKTALNEIGKSLNTQIQINNDILNIITSYESIIVEMNKMNLICDEMKNLINNKFNESTSKCNIVDYVLCKNTDKVPT